MTTQMLPQVRIIEEKLLSDNWYVLKTTRFELQRRDGSWQSQNRETYDRGNGATILLYNRSRKTVILTRQFRFPAYVNPRSGGGASHGMMVEACAGLLDLDDPITCIRRETEEETGYLIKDVRKVFEAYMSPGSVTERLFFFVGEYSAADKVSEGGGHAHEGEDIQVLEMTLDEALAQVANGEICDAKTIMLLQYAKLHDLMG
jgi:GDP-mannose pyrophosphatase NudK